MKIKVCGMKFPENIEELVMLQPDFLGFIFYKKSPRFVAEELNESQLLNIRNIKKVGVFVNEDLASIIEKVSKYKLDFVQLHGAEIPEFCRELKEKRINIIKAFGVDEDFEFSGLNAYKPFCDYFLFDTKTKAHGGSGKTFNWQVLEKYDNEIPFFLSGGIGVEELEKIDDLKLNIFGLDVNSRFESKPGVKDIEKLKKLFTAEAQSRRERP